MNAEVPVPNDPDRQAKVTGFIIRETMLAEMEKKVAAGDNFVDAAEDSGIPFECALARMEAGDETMRRWFLESKDRPMRSELPDTEVLPASRSPIEMKHGFLGMLWQAGLFHKAAKMVEVADIDDVRGQNVIGTMLKLSKDFFPRETSSKVDHTGDMEKQSREELEKRLEELGGKYKNLLNEMHQGNATRKRLAGLLEDGPEEDGGGPS